jgi:hypothetical protein
VTPVFWFKLNPVQNQQVHRAGFELLSYSLPPLQFLEQLTVLRGCERLRVQHSGGMQASRRASRT